MSYIYSGYIFNTPDSAIILSKSLYRFHKKHNYPLASAYGYHLQGIASFYKGDYPAYLKYYRQMADIYEELGDRNGIASSSINIGEIYFELDRKLIAIALDQVNQKTKYGKQLILDLHGGEKD